MSSMAASPPGDTGHSKYRCEHFKDYPCGLHHTQYAHQPHQIHTLIGSLVGCGKVGPRPDCSGLNSTMAQARPAMLTAHHERSAPHGRAARRAGRRPQEEAPVRVRRDEQPVDKVRHQRRDRRAARRDQAQQRVQQLAADVPHNDIAAEVTCMAAVKSTGNSLQARATTA